MIPMAKESKQLVERIQSIIMSAKRDVGEKEVAQMYEERYGVRLRDVLRGGGYGGVAEVVSGVKEVLVRRVGPDVVFSFKGVAVEEGAKPAASKGLMDLEAIIASLDPSLSSETYVYATIPRAAGFPPDLFPHLESYQNEPEGHSVIIPTHSTAHLPEGTPTTFTSKRITLKVHSSLESVGLTAKISSLFAKHGVPCNIVAGYHHDHLYVPVEKAEDALALLKNM
eukprot:TRINITY_DN16986_c0_g1_i1.p1 TRINITY_DN16986_c0_g1~~TRINITY_DN16986_c0_g1_i1.p1  ORF type:complete len:225 (+),score=44.58 TRINITY_DN16986_c0_g1_i1:66-740(+)